MLEVYWNGELLDSEEAVLGFAQNMTYARKHPAVYRVSQTYHKGVRRTKAEMRLLEGRLVRHADLPKWAVTIAPPPAAEIKAAGITPDQVKTSHFMRGRGCAHCNHTGYRGRKGIFEMLRMNAAMRDMTFNREPTQAIRRQARLLGMRTLLEDGILKSLAGITTLDEVLSICHHDFGAN